MIIATVVVTYNRLECLKRNLNCLFNQTRPIDRIYVIDNASVDGTGKFIRDLCSDRIIYIRMPENTGGSGGFHTGIKAAYEDGADYIWGMDDDAYPRCDALEQIVNMLPQRGLNCYWSNCDGDVCFNGPIKQIKDWMFVGFFIPKEVIEIVGLPRRDFFIYLDDYEYGYRIQKKGYKILKVAGSVIDHKASTQENYPEKRIGPIRIRWHRLPDWKYYYWVRNYILSFPWSDYNKYITLFLKTPKIFLFTVLFNKKQLKIFFKAYLDGVRGISGKTVQPF